MNTLTKAVAAVSAEKKKDERQMNVQIFSDIYETYYKKVYNYISYRINNHTYTEDLVSLVFEKVLEKYDTYKPETAPIEAWIIGISKNVIRDHFRKSNKFLFVPLDKFFDIPSDRVQPEDVIVQNEEKRDLIASMNCLKDREREILSLKFSTDLKNTEIAQIMGISEASAGMIIHRATTKLRRIMEVQ